MTLWPLAVYLAAVVFTAAALLFVSWIVGQRHRARARSAPYECGIPATGPSRLRISARFYVVALLFVIFDLEAVFLFAWALVAREAAWPGFAAILGFLAILLVGLLYEWREGVLDWSPTRRIRRATRREA